MNSEREELYYNRMEKLDEFKDVISWFNENYKRVSWDREKILKYFGNRSINQIEESGEIHYLCCLERTYLIAHEAKRRGINSDLLVFGIKRPLQFTKVGTALEVELDSELYYFVSATTREKLVKRGYESHDSHFGLTRLSASDVDPNLSLFDNLAQRGVGHFNELAPGFNPNKYLRFVAHKSSPKHLARCLKAYENGRISL